MGGWVGVGGQTRSFGGKKGRPRWRRETKGWRVEGAEPCDGRIGDKRE